MGWRRARGGERSLCEPREACGVFGVYAPGRSAAPMAFASLQQLQHRGEEAAGIAVADGHSLRDHHGMGLVREAFANFDLARLPGYIALGHTRYSTSGTPTLANAQPVFDVHRRFGIVHNGQLVNAAEPGHGLDEDAIPAGDAEAASGESDSRIVVDAISLALDRGSMHAGVDQPLTEALLSVLPHLRGAFTLGTMETDRLMVTRDRHGLRPLLLGKLDQGWVFASENAAITAAGGQYVRDVRPAELIIADRHGLRSLTWAEPQPRACLFEYVYFARADSELGGRSVYTARFQAGRRLASFGVPVQPDAVIAVPDTGTPAAMGYAVESGVEFAAGFVRSPYVGRTFIQPTTAGRLGNLEVKLTPIPAVVRGRRLIVVDDSIVRGNTQRTVIELLRQAGAAEVHLRIASPPIRWPCFYGFDFPNRTQLIAASRSVDAVRRRLGADSLEYLPLPELAAAIGKPLGELCRACMDGQYPVPVADRTPGSAALRGSARRAGVAQPSACP